MPQVQVTQDPVAVFVIVALIGGAALLALLFAGPWTARVPTVPEPVPDAQVDVSSDVGAPIADVATLATTDVLPAPIPWSTGSAPPEPPWAARPEDLVGH